MNETVFLEEVLHRPRDDAPRLAYADWLEERGDPRGEFIRLQCELAASLPPNAPWPGARELPRLLRLQAREAELLSSYAPQWLGPLLEFSAEFSFRRGFPNHVRLPASRFVERHDKLAAVAPITAVSLSGERIEISAVAESPLLAAIEALSLARSHLGPAALGTLLGSSQLGRLQALDLSSCGIGAADLQAFVRHNPAPRLQALWLNGNPDIGSRGAASLIEADRLASLRWLELAGCNLTDAFAQRLHTWPGLSRLRAMKLKDNPIGAGSLAELIASPYWPQRTLFEIGQRRYATVRKSSPSRLLSFRIASALSALKVSASPFGVAASRRRGRPSHGAAS